MTATERRYFVMYKFHGVDGLSLSFEGNTLAVACQIASGDPDTNGRVYELSDDGTVRLVAQMATVS